MEKETNSDQKESWVAYAKSPSDFPEISVFSSVQLSSS
jgi:hypothetical protein